MTEETMPISVEDAIKELERLSASIEARAASETSVSKDMAHFFEILDENLDIGTAIFDENQIYKFIGKTVYTQLGLTPQDVAPGDSLADMHAAMTKYGLLNKEIIEAENLTVITASSEQSDLVRSGINIVALANGTFQRLTRKRLSNGWVISQSHNVTDLIKKDIILQESLQLGQSGYWVFDFATKLYELSTSMVDAYSPQRIADVQTKGIISLLVEEDQAAFREGMRKLSQTDDRVTITGRTIFIDGKTSHIRTHARLIRDNEGKPSSIQAFNQNITREVKQKKALEKAKDEAVLASKAKSEFLANMSHEIRTPMNGVLGMAELLEQTDINERQRDYIKVITRSSQALLTIINDILDFSKIEAEAFELDPAPFNLREAIDDVMSLLSTSAHEKGLELIVDYPPTLPRGFIADVGRIRQVITNLVSNAVKFSDSGHVLLSVGITDGTDGNSAINIAIKDTGIGIDAEKLESVFKKFTQADGSTTRVYGGTGLGLTISRHIVELMGGALSVESTPGEGSTFTINLEFPVDETVQIEPILPALDLSGLKVLIVDDIEVNRNILSDRFGSWNMQTEAVGDAVDAIVSLKSANEAGAPYDLLVLDYLMPGMNGQELAALITSTKSLSGIPIVMLSSCDKPTTNAQMQAIGINNYLVKPVREDRLLKAVQKALSSKTISGQTISGQISGTASKGVFKNEGVSESAAPIAPLNPAPAIAPAPDISKTTLSETTPPSAPSAPVSIETDKPAMRDPLIASTQDVLRDIESALTFVTYADTGLEAEIEALSKSISEPETLLRSEPEITASASPTAQTAAQRTPILVAEDFPLNQDVVRLMLEDSDYKPVFANNGQEAVAIFKANPGIFKAILMDISMPVMDGYEAAEVIKNHVQTDDASDIPIIALTGHALKNDRNKCLDAHMDDYLTKPVKQPDLIATLDRWTRPQVDAEKISA
ncbi:MAG: response regulator [Robiginitomaculum sp.]